jgi:hypothetical protein
MKKAGRPSKYEEGFAKQARNLCLLGATDAQLAESFEVNVDTIHTWKRAHKEFSEAIKEAKETADAKVAESLYHRALGYQHPEEKIFCSDGSIVRAQTTKQYPPETVAAIFWLKNRQPAQWREKVELEHSGEIGIKRVVSDI